MNLKKTIASFHTIMFQNPILLHKISNGVEKTWMFSFKKSENKLRVAQE